ncbi:hypothetical protein IEO21_04575 [Rhodonia placenta]|uniref:Uncharacterized protein n=1 Tax=Rhodonia placenta TaxID=104341 RepID=A0A8H7P407_9APHY|nr:hypothetical protein IEO21_04575 [Postia placenta]
MLARRLPAVERLHILDGSFHKITLPSLFHPCLLEFESVTILQPTNIAFASVDSFIGMVLALRVLVNWSSGTRTGRSTLSSQLPPLTLRPSDSKDQDSAYRKGSLLTEIQLRRP